MAVARALEEPGASVNTVARDFPGEFIKYHGGITKYFKIIRPARDRDFKTEFHVYWGDPRTGKSKLAFDTAGAFGSVYYKPRGEWWDGYVQQDSVIIDDFYGWLKYDELLKLTDRYPYRVPIKGGFEIFNSKKIFITSNISPELWFKFPNYDHTALTKRIDVYFKFEFLLLSDEIKITNLLN